LLINQKKNSKDRGLAKKRGFVERQRISHEKIEILASNRGLTKKR
jgi:hypothetical protein